MVVLGDFNGDIGNSLGEKVKQETNQRGLKLTEFVSFFKGQLQREYKLLSYERALKMLKNDRCITVIGQAVLKVFDLKVDIPRKVRELGFLLRSA